MEQIRNTLNIISKIEEQVDTENGINTLMEGLRFGQKEMTLVDQFIGRFKMGVEYEFNPDVEKIVGDDYEDMPAMRDEDDLAKFLYDYFPVEMRRNFESHNGENGGDTVEYVTTINSVPNGLKFMKRMFEYIREFGSTDETTGLHISISTVNPETVNLTKFLILLDMGFISDEFEERDGVSSLYNVIMNKIGNYIENEIEEIDVEEFLNSSMGSNEILHKVMTSITERVFEDEGFFNEKFQSIKFGDYTWSNGRIELRYFGGTDYEEQYDNIEFHIYRALYVLMIASTNAYNKQYKQAISKLVLRALENNTDEYGVEWGTILNDMNRATKLYHKGNEEQIKRFLDSDPNISEKLSAELSKRWRELNGTD